MIFNLKKKTLGFAASLAFVFASSALATSLTPEQTARAVKFRAAAAARISSYRNVILTSAGGPLIESLSSNRPGCGEVVRRIYKANGSLYSPIIDSTATLLKDFPKFSKKQDDVYYHVTNSESYMNAFKDFGPASKRLGRQNPFERTLLFNRTRPARPVYHDGWERVMYVAESLETISFFSTFGIELEVSPDARMVDLNQKNWERALAELGERFPELAKKCGTKFDTSLQDMYATVNFHALVWLVAEDSGIDAMEYFQGGRWFQMLTPEVFVSAKTLGVVGGRNNGVTYDDQKKLDLGILDVPVISVRSAFFGKKVAKNEKDTDVTAAAADFVDGKVEVTRYKPSAKYLGDPAPGVAKDFDITWDCLRGGQASRKVGVTHTLHVPAEDVEKKTVSISCASEGVQFPGSDKLAGTWERAVKDGEVTQVYASANGHVYGLGLDGAVYYINGDHWDKVSTGGVTSFTVKDDGSLYVVGTDQNLYTLHPNDRGFNKITGDGAVKFVTPVPNGDVYGIGKDDSVVYLKAGTAKFEPFRPGKVDQLFTSQLGRVYIKDEKGVVSRLEADGSWKVMTSAFGGTVRVGFDERLYGMSGGAIFEWKRPGVWKAVAPRMVKDFAVGKDYIYGLGTPSIDLDNAVVRYPLAPAEPAKPAAKPQAAPKKASH